jgi:hypothetical protein
MTPNHVSYCIRGNLAFVSKKPTLRNAQESTVTTEQSKGARGSTDSHHYHIDRFIKEKLGGLGDGKSGREEGN